MLKVQMPSWKRERRYKTVYISEQDILDLFREHKGMHRITYFREKDLAGAEIVHVDYDFQGGGFKFTLEREDWDPVPIGSYPPVIYEKYQKIVRGGEE